MHPTLKRLLTDHVRISTRTALDASSPYYTDGVYADPVLVPCRVDRKPRRVAGNDGDTIAIDATVICEEQVSLTAKIWLPEDPPSAAGRVVKTSTAVYDERGKLHHYEVTV
jgi:hypothetical protein